VLYVAIILGVSVVGISIILLRQRGARGPRTMDESIEQFSRARSAISPDSSGRVTPPSPDVVRDDQQGRRGLAGTE
jgi:hypothetical protein